jgi:hypothetical protein
MTGGCFASVMTLLITFSVAKVSFLGSLVIAAIPLLLTLLYVYGFRHGKPPGYDTDCLDLWIKGSGFGPDVGSQPGYPLIKGHHVR